MKTDQPPQDDSSPICVLHTELLEHVLSYVPLQENLGLKDVNKSWQKSWNVEMERQMNSLGHSRGIQEPISNPDGFNDLWESQSKEISFLLGKKENVLNNTNWVQTVITAYKKLETAKDQPKSAFALHIRERVLEKLNTAIIERQIQKSKTKPDDKELHCNDCGLTRFPASLLENDAQFWQSLKRLYVQDNRLTALPKNLGQCVRLKELCASNNQLAELPESISQCQALYMLDVYNNHLTELPDMLAQCAKLEWVYISKNFIRSLPDKQLNFTFRHDIIGELSKDLVLSLQNEMPVSNDNEIKERPFKKPRLA